MSTTNFLLSQGAASAVAALRTDVHSPYTAMIEVADRCNEVCVHCYQVQGQKGEMTTEEVCSVMDQLAELGVIFLTLSGGEATLRSDFLELVAHARKLRFAVKLYTNGLRIDDAMADRLAELAVQEVQMSLYSPRPEVHDWVTRVPGSHQRTVAAVRRLVARKVRVVVKTPVMRFNAHDRDRFIDLVEDIGAHYMLSTHVDPREDGVRDPEMLSIDHGTNLDIRRDSRVFGETEEEPEPRAPKLDRAPCGACSGMVHVEPNGEVHPCTQLNLRIGGALDEGGIAKAWQENAEARLLRHTTYADLHGCRDCALHPYCARCYANALTQAGDAFGPYASACADARLEYELAHGEPAQIIDQPDAMGPYAAVAGNAFRTIEDRLTEEDRARYAKHAWLRQPVKAEPLAPAGGLVQIRRPGARMPEPLQWPGASPTSHEDESGKANPTAAE
ncbi:MAG: radical SAM protein [Deltaproteobacteria bacterium]|nr:radical SAM protein [Deltaproteobacteria bacterium]